MKRINAYKYSLIPCFQYRPAPSAVSPTPHLSTEILSYLQALVMGRNGRLPSCKEQRQGSGVLIDSE